LRSALRRVTGRSQLTRADLFRRDWLAAARTKRPDASPEEQLDARYGLSSILWTLSFRTMLSSLLRFGDRLSMAHSREVRLPFCDHRIAEYVFGLPPELLVGSGQVKRVLREAIRGFVPDAIVTRPKQGFVPPQTSWLLGPRAKLAADLAAESGPIAAVLDRRKAMLLAGSHRAIRLRESATLWNLVNLAAWSRYSWVRMSEAKKLATTVSRDGTPAP